MNGFLRVLGSENDSMMMGLYNKKIFKSLGENNFPPIILNLARGSSKHEINIFRYEKFLER